MSTSDLPDWIYPGARVLIETTTPGASQRVTQREVVSKITKTQIVLKNTDTRIRRKDLRGVGEQPYGNRYKLLDPNSEQGIIAWRREEIRRIKAKAREALNSLGNGLTDPDLVDKAILALTRWAETLKTTTKEFL